MSANPSDANPDWRTYRTGGPDKAGRLIEKVYSLDDNYVVYFYDCELFYETRPRLVPPAHLGSADAALARINRLLPDNPTEKESKEYRNKFSTLELVADAYEMIFCGEIAEGLQILASIQEKLQTTEEGKRRLIYQAGALSLTVLIWIIYGYLMWMAILPANWEPWVLSAALAMLGGVFSVRLTIDSLQVSVNQEKVFLLSAGATRVLVAMLAGIVLLVAMRAKMFAGVGYPGNPPYISTPLLVIEIFFCILAGFSESFVPNILRDGERKSNSNTTPTSPVPPVSGTTTPVPPNPLQPRAVPANPLRPPGAPQSPPQTQTQQKGTGTV